LKLAVVGAWGYLGANLLELTDSCGVARRSSAEKRPFLNEAFKDKEMYLIDEISEEELREVLERCGADAVVYAAGKLFGKREEMYDSHVTKALISLRVAKELGLKYVYVSSVAAMGLADACEEGGKVREEGELLKGCVPLGKYSETKAEGERAVWREGGSIVRPALIVGKWAYRPEWKLLNFARERSLPVPNMNVSSAECVAKAIERAASEPGWYLAVDGTLRDLGFRAYDLKPPKAVIKALRPVAHALVVMRYRYESRRLKC